MPCTIRSLIQNRINVSVSFEKNMVASRASLTRLFLFDVLSSTRSLGIIRKTLVMAVRILVLLERTNGCESTLGVACNDRQRDPRAVSSDVFACDHKLCSAYLDLLLKLPFHSVDPFSTKSLGEEYRSVAKLLHL